MTELDVNREPDYDRLLNLKALSQWTLDRQREHATDTRAYEAALAAFQAGLRSQHVDGDGKFSAARRARKVEKHLKALVKASRKAEAAAESLRTTYAAHVAHVAALPAQREAKALQKAGRREALGELTGKSLHKTASHFAPPGEEVGATGPTGVESARQPRGLDDVWQQGA